MYSAYIEMENENSLKKRYIAIIVAVISIFTFFIVRLVDWQIINGAAYRGRVDRSNSYSVQTEAVRGEILDANGLELAVNSTGYKIMLDHLYLQRGTENNIISDLLDLMEKKGEPWLDILPISVSSSGSYEFIADKDDEIKKLKKTLVLNSYATAKDCMENLIQKYNCKEYPKKKQRDIISVRYGMTKAGYDNSITCFYTFAENISQELVAIVSEKSQVISGISIGTTAVRKYLNGTVAPHIVGRVGSLSQEEYDKLKDTYKLDDKIGKNGIEKVMEEYLKGKGGEKLVEATSGGSVLNVLEVEKAYPGKTIYLTIDSRIQQVANKSLEENVLAAKRIGIKDCKAGAVVALSVKDFSVIAAATYPSYDLQQYVESKDYYNQIASDTVSTPLLNRAFNGAFTPGSVYKPAVASAALEEGAITKSSNITCNGRFDYYAGSGFYIRCMGHHGSIPVMTALAKSCNVFFSETGRRLGIDSLDLYARKFGLGIKTGIELSESAGILAGPEYSNSMGAIWYAGNTSQASIGQSDNMFTPLQLATYAATIANGGNRYKTHVVKKVTDYVREETILEKNAELVENVGISDENLGIVKEGMRQVVLSGTATDFRGFPIAVAGKTGTAQNSGTDHTTFICFAPYDKPEIAIAVVIEHGSKGMLSKNVARDILKAYFNLS